MRARKGAHCLQAPLASVNVFIMPLSKVWRQRRDLPDERSQPGERIARFGRQLDGVVLDDRGDAHGGK